MTAVQKIPIIIFILALLAAAAIYILPKNSPPEPPNLSLTKNINMKLTSPVFQNDQFIPSKYSCDGENINPPLEILEVPNAAKSLALIVDDPDAPGGTWVHWVVFNINQSVALIQENSVPEERIQGLTSFSQHSYGGPCPPSGIHHYHFKLYALDTMLSLNSSANKEEIKKAMQNHILDWVDLVGLYKRQ